MTTKRVGWAFMWMVIAFLGTSIISSLFFRNMDIMTAALLSELCLLVPACYYLLKGRVGLKRQLHFSCVSRPSTIMLSLVYLICCYPLVISMNAFTMAITSNEAQSITDEFAGIPPFLVWLIVGFIGPVAEEIVFRGMILGGLRSTGRILSAIVLSGFLFGLMHLNLNQFSYTVIMGIFWGLLVEASGSILTSMICHISMNSLSVIMVFAIGDSLEELTGILGESEEAVSSMEFVGVGLMFLINGIGFAALAMLILKVIALNEGRTGCVENIFRRKIRAEKYGHLFSVPLIIGILMTAAVIIRDTVLGLI